MIAPDISQKDRDAMAADNKAIAEEARKEKEAEEKAKAERLANYEKLKQKQEKERQESIDPTKVWEKSSTETMDKSMSAANTANKASALMRGGLSKSMAANLGQATLASDTLTDYAEGAQEDADMMFKTNLQKAIADLTAQGKTQEAKNLEQAASLSSQAQMWSDIAGWAKFGTETLKEFM